MTTKDHKFEVKKKVTNLHLRVLDQEEEEMLEDELTPDEKEDA